MKKNYFLLILILISTSVIGQKLVNHQAGIYFGTSNYYGDLANTGQLFNPKGLQTKSFDFTTGIDYRLNFHKFATLKTQLAYVRIQGHDSRTNDLARKNRNIHFRSDIFDMSAMLEWNILPYQIGETYKKNFKTPFVTPFVGIGVAGFYYVPQAKLNGRSYNLHKYKTEGQGIIDGTKQYKLFQFAVPFSLGLKYNITSDLALGFEFQYRFTFTDYLDDISGSYVDKSVFDSYYSAEDAAIADAFNYRAIDKDLTQKHLEQRGDPNDKDHYFMMGLSIAYKFSTRVERMLNSRNSKTLTKKERLERKAENENAIVAKANEEPAVIAEDITETPKETPKIIEEKETITEASKPIKEVLVDEPGGLKEEDIKEEQQEDKSQIKGVILDEITNSPLSAKVVISYLDSDATYKVITSNLSDGNFKEPIEVGKEYTLKVTKEGYLPYTEKISLRNTIKGDDFEFSAKLKKEELVDKSEIKGTVIDKTTSTPLDADITISYFETDAKYKSTSSNASDGNFKEPIEVGKDYTIDVMKKGYFPYSEKISLTNVTEGDDFKFIVKLRKIEKGVEIPFKEVYFATNSYILLPISMKELDRFSSFLRLNDDILVILSGHTDNVGSSSSNRSLSDKRAKAVLNYLISKGIPNSRLNSIGYGEDKPRTTNDTKEGRALNRRTSYEIK